MSIPTKFNPMGARVCGEPAPIEYKDFVQPVLLSSTTIDRTQPYSFGMSITNDFSNATAWQAFDGDAMSMWQFPSTQFITYLEITFDHPVLIEEVQVDWEVPKKVMTLLITGYNDELETVGKLVNASSTKARLKSFPVNPPVEAKSVKISVAQQGSSVLEMKFIGKYNAIYDKKSD